MVRKIIYFLLAPRHPWREVSFNELSEMYVAGFLKNFAQGMVGVFLPLYLIKTGYSLQQVLLYYTILYAFMLATDVGAAHLVARFGPKHVMRVGFFMQFIHALLLTQLESLPLPLLILPLVHAVSAGFYWLPYHVDFSKVKHTKHGGKELGWLALMERIGGIAGPILGGVLATFFGAPALFFCAALLVAVAVVILMLNPEPVKTHQKLYFKGLMKGQRRNTISVMAFVAENALTILLWPTFLATVVFTTDAYLKIGTVTSLSVAIAVVVAMPLAHLLDKTSGRKMLQFGTIFNALVHLSRPFVHGIFGASVVALANEPGTLVYRLPYLKAYYDTADDYPGQRIAYITKNELCAHAGCLVVFGSLAVLAGAINSRAVFGVGFTIAALLSLMIMLQKYRILR